jgi:hypothetical protein
MQITGDYTKAFLKCQHKFRGLVSAFKSTKFVKEKRFDHSFLFRSGYRELMLEARSTLHYSMYSEYLQWASFHVKHQLPELSRYPTGYDELEGLARKAPIVSVDQEVYWIVARINEDCAVINTFRKIATHVEQYILEDDALGGIEFLKQLELMLGASFWSVQLRIALENIAGGLEGQKKYTSEVRSIYRSGLLNFIAYNTSVRNEDRVSIQKYSLDIKQRIDNHSKYDDSVKTYMHHRIMGDWPSDSDKIADVLRVEQSHSLIDVYETFISLLQYSLRDDVSISVKALMKSALLQVKNIEDFRLEKARLLYGLPSSCKSLECRDSRLPEALCSGDILLAAKLSRFCLRNKSNKLDAWNYIYSGVAFSFGKSTPRSTTINNTPLLIAQLLRQDGQSSTAYANLLKLATNLAGLPSYAAIRTFLATIYRIRPNEKWRFDLISMNTPTIGIEDNVTPTRINNAPNLSDCWAQLFNPSTSPINRGSSTLALFQACGLIGAGDYDPAITILTSYRTLFPNALPALTIPLLLNSYYSADMRQHVIELIANEGSRNSSRLELIPIENTIGDYYVQDYNRITNFLIAPIALHMLWEKTEKDTVGSSLRFKTAQVIRRKDVQAPAALYEFKETLDLHVLVYFLREVCVPNIVDQARIVKTTTEILQQRQDTCSVLRELDPDRAGDYEDEIFEITNRQIMTAGQWIVDRTRIHVDVSALTRWATRELSEDFYRYSDLAKVVTAMEFDEVMRDILLENQIPIQFSDFDEADAVLYSMLVKLASEFLNNSLFGLDYYLSKRIRHQSFVGLIRGPLELQNIITTKETGSSGYNRNDVWLDKFNSCGRDTVAALEKIFNKFSSSFDEALIETKDKIIQIKSKEHPQGLVTFEITPQIIPVARILFQDGDMPGFVKTSVGLMWALLDKSLRDVREYIGGELKPNLTIVFDEFRAQLKNLVEGRAEYYELGRAIGDSSVQVQIALDDASSWFSKNNDVDAFRRTFNASQAVSISIEAAKKCLRSFEPVISIEPISTDIDVMPSTLVFLHDVLFVSLDNARVHSGLKMPKVRIEVEPDIEGEKFVIRTQCQAKSSVRIGAEKKLSEIREKIERGEYDTKTKTEGGSGLYKIAAVVKQSAMGAIEFGFNSSGDFEIAVTYHFLVQARQAEEAS